MPWFRAFIFGASVEERFGGALVSCYNRFAMTTAEMVLVPANTVVTAKGDGQALEVSCAAHHVFLVTLSITKIIEQESLDVSIFGSADGATWEPKSLAAFPQKFYTEESPLLLDLTATPNIKFVRAHWEVARWGRGTETPMFEFGVTMKEVPAQILQEARAEAKALA
jgi:hypothetical protein